MSVKTIIKRDGRKVAFDPSKITSAIMKAVNQVGGDDESEAKRMTDIIVELLEKKGEGAPRVETIQDLVEKVLIEEGHAKTAKEYILFRANRDRVRDMNSSLMRSFEELTFGSSNDVEIKRENANIDGDTAMGTMLRYGSEGAKQFNLMYLVSPEFSRAHKRGDIHIHDLDFLALTETCVVENSKVVLRLGRKSSSEVIEVDMKYFDKYLDDFAPDTVVGLCDTYIWSCGSFRKVRNCVRHDSHGKRVLRIHSKAATVEVTDNHTILIKDTDSNELIDIKASEIEKMFNDGKRISLSSDIYVDDTIKYAKFDEAEYEINSVEEIEYTGRYVYDIETTNHYFMTNGVTVHNCCQIDLEKLFRGGFNTGHGFLREPGEIRSYAALTCIAIQSNQNEMHRVV